MQQPVENIVRPNHSYLVFQPSIDAERAFDKAPQAVPQKQLEPNSTNVTANGGPLESRVGCRAPAEGTSDLHVYLLMSAWLDGISPESCLWAFAALGDRLKGTRQAGPGSSWFPVTVAEASM